jgi:hypothetical protein
MNGKQGASVVNVCRVDAEIPACKQTHDSEAGVCRQQDDEYGSDAFHFSVIKAVYKIVRIKHPGRGYRGSPYVQEEVKARIAQVIQRTGQSVENPPQNINDDERHAEDDQGAEQPVLSQDSLKPVMGMHQNERQNYKRYDTHIKRF